jgi:MFS family permease
VTSDRLAAPRSDAAVAATAFAFSVTMAGTTLPTPLYPLYVAELHFTALTVTILFAVYALGVVAALATFGRLSDQLGRRPVMAMALSLAALSAVLFVLPRSLPLLIVARVISGLSAGLMSGTGTAAVIDVVGPTRRAFGGTLALAANMGGLGAGTLLAGILADTAPHPLVVPFVVDLVLTAAGLLALFVAVPAARPDHPRGPIRPQRLRVPAQIRGAFTRAVLAGGAGFAVMGVLTAVSALFLARYLDLTSHTLAGFVVFLAFASLAAGQLLSSRLSEPSTLPTGCAALVVAAGFLALALDERWLAPLLICAVALGIGGGLCLSAGIASTVGQVEPSERGTVSSAFFAGVYLLLALPAIGVGVLARFSNVRDAGMVFSALVAVLAAAVGIAEVVVRTNRGPASRPVQQSG